MRLPFGAAAWYFMAFCEDWAFAHLMSSHGQTIHHAALFADSFMTHLKNASYWLYSSCAAGGSPPCAYDAGYYQAARDLSDVSQNYDPFEWAFTWASRGVITLSVKDSTIIPSSGFLDDTRYEAYDRLVKPVEVLPSADGRDITDLVASSLTVSGSTFRYRLSPRLVAQTMEMLGPALDVKYSLPEHWRLPRYSMGDFKRFSKCLATMSYIHYVARTVAALRGCEAAGYSGSILLASATELHNRLVRYTGCSSQVVAALIEDLTYAGRDVSRPDPALQPLIRLNQDVYGVQPNLLIQSSVERNFVVLLNRLAEERDAYSKVIGEKEALMVQWIMESLSIPGVRYFHGTIPGERDGRGIDLAVIGDDEKVCIFLELKWFVEPAEVREMIEKSEEIGKGVSQLQGLSQSMQDDPSPFFRALQINASYRLLFAVASDSFIGMADVQDPSIPVVRHRHLVTKANTLGSLSQLHAWLSKREYLPVTGEHYEIRERIWTVGRWGIRWYGILPLVEHEFV
jgi:hypothetical protein